MTNINSMGVAFILLGGMATLFLPRRFALVPLIVTACYMTMDQVLLIVGFNFSILRIMIFICWIRLIFRQEAKMFTFNVLDKAISWWVAINVLVYCLSTMSMQDVVNRLGFAYNVFGLYFLMRCYINEVDDCYFILKSLVIILIPLSLMMVLERTTGRNSFAIWGGVPEITQIRDGKIRAYGPFGNPILVGIMAASSLPLFIGLWFSNHISKILLIAGIVSALLIIVTSNSGGPIIVFAAAIIGFFMWPFREYMGIVKYMILFTMVALHFSMKAPIWYLLAKVSSLTGGGGWYRSELINQSIEHIDEWWLAGTRYTVHWMPTGLDNDPNMTDIANGYIRQGVDGGLITLVLFVFIIVAGFKCISAALRANRHGEYSVNVFIWSLGVALFSHAIAYLNVSYFDQTMIFWYLLLAMIAITGKIKPSFSENDQELETSHGWSQTT